MKNKKFDTSGTQQLMTYID